MFICENLCDFLFKRCNYDTIDDIDNITEKEVFLECINLLKINEPYLILSYNLENGTLLFSSGWKKWLSMLDNHFKDFISQFNQIEVHDNSIIQKIYFCKIPERYYTTFLTFLQTIYK